MIKPWLILTKNWFRSRIGWNVTKWSRCLHIEQFCISQLFVCNWKGSAFIWLQLIDNISNEIISIIGDWVSCIGCLLVAHCCIKFNFKYWNVLQCHLVTVTFFGYKNREWLNPMFYRNRTQTANQTSALNVASFVIGYSLPKRLFESLSNPLLNFLTVPESKFSSKLPFEFRPW